MVSQGYRMAQRRKIGFDQRSLRRRGGMGGEVALDPILDGFACAMLRHEEACIIARRGDRLVSHRAIERIVHRGGFALQKASQIGTTRTTHEILFSPSSVASIALRLASNDHASV